ncbi:hypothetical protein SBADM41S_02334 [Streptomyces badius]
MAEFTLELNDDQKQVKEWLHGFAADVIRPAAAEWDEREETPWPVIQEAAKVGIYSLDFYAQQFFDPTGLGIPMAMEELFWGDAGIALSIVGTGLAAVGVLANGTEEQIGTWIPQMYGDADDVKVAAFCSSEPDAGSDVASMRTRAAATPLSVSRISSVMPSVTAYSSTAASSPPSPWPRAEGRTISLATSARWRAFGRGARTRAIVPETRPPSRAIQMPMLPASTAAARSRHQTAAVSRSNGARKPTEEPSSTVSTSRPARSSAYVTSSGAVTWTISVMSGGPFAAERSKGAERKGRGAGVRAGRSAGRNGPAPAPRSGSGTGRAA